VSFQGQGFQGNGFQVGLPGAYPFTPATNTSYIEGLPDRVRLVLYQGLAVAPSPPTAATVTPITAGLQDIDKAFRGRFVAPQLQFSTFTQNDQRTATPITAGIQDFDAAQRRRMLAAPQDISFARSQAASFETEGFDDFDQIIIRRPRVPPQDVTFTLFTQAQFETEGFDDFDQFVRRLPGVPQMFSGFATISGVIASTPITAGIQGFDQTARARLRLLQEITFTAFVSTFPESEGWDDFDVLQPARRKLPLWDITTSYPTTAATVTPTTAGVEPTFGPLFKRPYLDHLHVTYPSNQSAVAQTPITAGLQDFDYRFRPQFKAPQFQFSGFIVFDTRAATPFTAGVQDFDLASFRRPARIQDFGASLISQIRAITAGIQGFDATISARSRRPEGFPPVLTPAAAATAGVQSVEALLRRRSQADQFNASVASPAAATATPITAGLQDLDYRFVRPFRPALQQVTSYAPANIVLAITPSPFQFAVSGLPPFRYGMRVSLQTFESRGQNVGIKFIVHVPAESGLLTPVVLTATSAVTTLSGLSAPPTLGGTDADPDLSGQESDPDLSGEVEN
jgi:hypothetical protein